MAEKKRKGKRVAGPTHRRSSPGNKARSAGKTAPAAAGKREERRECRSGKILRQTTICSVLFVAVVALKLLCPQTLDPVRGEILRLMGNETDFTAVFSDLGRAVGREDLGAAIADACTEVFGSSSVAQTTDGTACALPENVCMTQQILGFAYAAPLQGGVNAPFGYREHPTTKVRQFHYGLDLQGDQGEVICSFADGTVTAIGESAALGKYLTVVHENGYTTLYAHCSRITASAGQTVKLGDPIAEVGQTGEATGPHLHFELYRDTLYLNPVYYV